MKRTPEQRESLVRDVAAAVNSNSAENQSNTPDFVLAELMVKALEGFEEATHSRADCRKADY